MIIDIITHAIVLFIGIGFGTVGGIHYCVHNPDHFMEKVQEKQEENMERFYD